ncbi:restriction endonuclease [Thioalkalivibrio sp. ALgr3]|uniref:restriction endonuclease n=1 Tax=Thioalkalivibrio sp. ALgr3 TaxID=1239292 RepID=UPI0012DF9074|nr:restriction endonuclease [Thioalkalivibrio sp. ALgr3]
MNTVAKGDAFEDEVFQALKRELEEGRLGLAPASARMFQKKGYYSKDREKEIVVDISIEVWRPGAENFSLLWVCECKDYESPIPVDDIEEFKAKLDQIAGKNVKGVVVTKRAFQSGALTFARNQGIGLVRIMPSDQVSWFMDFMGVHSHDRKTLSSRDFRAALTKENHQAKERDFYATSDGRIYGGWHALLRYALQPDS